MADLLIELFSEEIPARMQVQAAKDLEKVVVGALSDRGFLFEGVRAFSGPRRLTLAMTGLAVQQPDVKEEKKGPRTNAPQKAIEGFLRAAGVTLDQCQMQNDGKGEFYVAVIERKGRDTAAVLAEMLPECFAKLPWPKSMRFPGSPVRWVRPLHGIVCMFDGEVVPFEFAGVTSGNTTRGHRFLSNGKPIAVRHFDDYVAALEKAYVVLEADKRKDIIRHEATQKAFALGLELIADEGLLNEVSGLAEWPVVLIGKIQNEFMDVPPEILQTSMRTHQKYFSLRDPKTGRMAARFAVVANMVAEDGGKEIVAGNERVLRARLSDAKFFWDQDRKRTLESRVDDLKNIVFHAKLGTQYERVERIEALAGEIAEKIGADVKKARRAARLCKADLTSGVVGEFPELQGVMGRYYALHDDLDPDIADAIRDHYKPIGPTDTVPTNKVSIVVALADKLDALTGFFLNELMPTGSSDPFALRRAALGVVNILLKNGVHIRLMQPIAQSSVEHFRLDAFARRESIVEGLLAATDAAGFELQPDQFKNFLDAAIDDGERELASKFFSAYVVCQHRLLQFITDRLKVALREKGVRHDLLDAVFVFSRDDDVVRLVSRVEALQAFLMSDDGGNLLTAYRRGANILRTEEKKEGKEYRAPIEFPTLTDSDKKTLGEMVVFAEVDPKLFALPEEKALADALGAAEKAIAADVQAEQFVEAMGVMAGLRKPVDAFFDKVTVNDKDAKLRENRLKLLARLRATLHLAADFSKIEG